jgi:sec-independent protein translocase protein TatA
MGELSPWHWAVVILVAVLLFGSTRLPDVARSLGRSARILKAELREGAATPPASNRSAAGPDRAPEPGEAAVTGPAAQHERTEAAATPEPPHPARG